MTTITAKVLQSAKPKSTPYFIRDDKVKGFAAKVNPSGSIKLIAEVRHEGRTNRKTIGQYPHIVIGDARTQSINFIQQVRTGNLKKPTADLTLETLFTDYVKGDRLKASTLKCYREVIFFYLSDWLSKPVASITKQMVENRFYRIRDKGMSGGIPTYSQATKTMRILSALLNYAMADEIIESNPVQVLKLKRIDRSLRKRENYLPANRVRELLHISSQEAHPVTLAVHLILYTGLRKNEALRLIWSDIEQIEDIPCLIIRDTKNKRPHYVPLTQEIQKVLDRAKSSSPFIFPSTQKRDAPMGDERPTIRRLSKLINYDFRCHDLRRTFATRASEVGIDYLMVKRLLNHKSNDITAQYIQWNSRDNLLVMKKALESIVY
ncbi:MAG: integrase [Desulforhopalus sp.]|jgi:integrase